MKNIVNGSKGLATHSAHAVLLKALKSQDQDGYHVISLKISGVSAEG